MFARKDCKPKIGNSTMVIPIFCLWGKEDETFGLRRKCRKSPQKEYWSLGNQEMSKTSLQKSYYLF